MDQWQHQLFQTLTETPGAPGFEGEMRKVLKPYLEQYADEVVQDNLGSIFGIKRGNEQGPVIMVAGHLDEVSFMVTQITERGFLRFQTLGSWWQQVLLSQRVQVITTKGPVPGVIGSVPPHLIKEELRKKATEFEQMFIDIGADSREEAEAMGIRPGQPAVPVCPYTVMASGKRVMAKAWDNRFGCGMAVELLKELQGVAHPNTVYAGASVQEEPGLRGSRTAAQMIGPDLFFAVDAGPAGDIPGVEQGFGKLGKGTLLRIYDRSMIPHLGLRDYVLDTAESHGIPYQFFVSQGGTDAGAVHLTGSGVPSFVIGIPARYIHSHVSVIDTDDYAAAKALLVTLVKNLDRTALTEIKKR